MEALEGAIWGPLPLLAALPLLALGLYCCYIQYVHTKYEHIPGPPRDSFLLGHLPSIWKMLMKDNSILDLFWQWSEEYGPIIRVNAFHRVSVLMFSPEGVKEYLMLPEYPKDPLSYGRLFNLFGVRFLGNGLVTAQNYDHWHKQRKIMDPAFSRTFLIGLMENFNDKAEELMEILEEKADGETEVDLMDLLYRVTLDIISKVAFGIETNSLHDDQVPFPHAVSMIMKGLSKTRKPFFKYLPWNRKVVKEVQESLRILRCTGKECIERRRKAIQDGEEIPQDILTQILKNAEKDHDDENMLDNFVTFFFAGHETTANQLSFTIMELGRQPEVLMRLQAELDEVIGVKRDITYEDLGKFQYLSQVLKEVLRLYPPAPGTMRWTGKEKIIEGVKIPARTTLMMEAKIVMAKFLQRFEFELAQPQSFQILDTGTLRPLDGVICKLKLRHQSGCED